MSELYATTPESLDEAIRGDFCSCNHLAHGNGKCYEINFNGTVWSNCRCEKTNLEFCLVLTPAEFENVSKLQDDRRNRRAA